MLTSGSGSEDVVVVAAVVVVVVGTVVDVVVRGISSWWALLGFGEMCFFRFPVAMAPALLKT